MDLNWGPSEHNTLFLNHLSHGRWFCQRMTPRFIFGTFADAYYLFAILTWLWTLKCSGQLRYGRVIWKQGTQMTLMFLNFFFFTWHWKQSLGQVVLRRAVKLYRYHWVCLIRQCSCYQEMPVSNPLIGILGSLIVFLLSSTHTWVPD